LANVSNNHVLTTFSSFCIVYTGRSVLHKINPQVQRAVADAGLAMVAVKTRTRPWRNEKEAHDYDTLLELNLEEAARQEGGKVEQELIIDGEPMFYSIMRGALQVGGCD
jgi:hypothetical protein